MNRLGMPCLSASGHVSSLCAYQALALLTGSMLLPANRLHCVSQAASGGNTAERQGMALKPSRAHYSLRLLPDQVTLRASVYSAKAGGASGYSGDW